MKLTQLEIEGFRGYPRGVQFDLDGNAIVLVASNGQGKTSFFDAILWALVGTVPRLGTSDDAVVSRYSQTGLARVQLGLTDAQGDLVLTRATDGDRERTVLREGDREWSQDSAKARLVERVWPRSSYAVDSRAAMTRALLRCVYLQQDRLRGFLEADTDTDRFLAISELVGVGQITELKNELDRARRAWSRTTGQEKKELEVLERRLLTLRSELERLGRASEPNDSADLESQWTSWWEELRGAGLAVEAISLDAPSAADRLEAALAAIDAERRDTDRRGARLERILGARTVLEAEDPDPTAQEVSLRESELAAVREHIAAINRQIDTAEGAAAERRLAQLRHRERTKELGALAELAQRHLLDHCPVCAQSIERDRVSERLNQLIADASHGVDSVEGGDLVDQLAAHRLELDEQRIKLEQAVRTARQSRQELEQRRAKLEDDLAALGIAPEGSDDVRAAVAKLSNTLDVNKSRYERLRQQGESLSLALRRRLERLSSRNKSKELDDLQSQAKRAREALGLRARVAQVAQDLFEALETAESEVVERRVKALAPLLERIYGRMDPHPSFTSVILAASTYYSKGRLNATIADQRMGLSDLDPTVVLSSAQINALALSIFLSFNLGLDRIPITAALLDDPIQSLDDVNLLGLADLLRRAKSHRQVIVSTHDERLGQLLARKLRPIRRGERTIRIGLEGWSRGGPRVTSDVAVADESPVRVVA